MIQRKKNGEMKRNQLLAGVVIVLVLMFFITAYIVGLLWIPSYIISLYNEELIRYWVIFVISITAFCALRETWKEF